MKRKILFSPILILLLLTISLNCYAFIIPLSKEELILKSDYVFHGIVTEVTSAWTDDHSYIYTYVTLEVLDVFKGELKDEVIMRLRGGLIDGKGIASSDQPELEVGMEVIIHALLLDNGYLYHKGGERGVYYINDGILSNSLGELDMTIDQYRDFVGEVMSQEEGKDDE